MDISHNRGPTGEPGGEASLLVTSRDRKRWLWKHSSCLYGGPVRRVWREDFFSGDPEGYVKAGSGNRRPSP